jgi:hypothetical protein
VSAAGTRSVVKYAPSSASVVCRARSTFSAQIDTRTYGHNDLYFALPHYAVVGLANTLILKRLLHIHGGDRGVEQSVSVCAQLDIASHMTNNCDVLACVQWGCWSLASAAGAAAVVAAAASCMCMCSCHVHASMAAAAAAAAAAHTAWLAHRAAVDLSCVRDGAFAVIPLQVATARHPAVHWAPC